MQLLSGWLRHDSAPGDLGTCQRRIAGWLVVAGLAVLLPAGSLTVSAGERYSVEPPVHQWIALQAYHKLVIQLGATDPFVGEIGAYLPTSESDAHYIDSFTYSANWAANKDAPYDTVTALIEGVYEEDQGTYPQGSFNFARPLWHFWNPDGAYDAGIAGFGSALQRAQSHYATALAQYHNGNKSQAHYWLGRCLHLLCDMSIPAHVQLDDHTPLEGGDSYENYAAVETYYRTIRAENALEVPVRSYPQATPSGFNAELTSIFYSLADYADQFDSDDVNGSSTEFGQGRYNLTGGISTTVLRDVYMPNLMGRAITSAARLCELFWRETGANSAEPHPADTNGDWTLTVAEFNAYATAWKAGQAWSTGPNPIPINYLTRAGYLAANGSEYRQASGLSLPTSWEPEPGHRTRR